MKIISTVSLVVLTGCVTIAIYWIIKELKNKSNVQED